MFFKYNPIESEGLAVRQSTFVKVQKLRAGGYLLLPSEPERFCSTIDAAITRLAALIGDPDEVIAKIEQTDNRLNFFDVGPVWNKMEYDDPWYDGLKLYETIEEANAEVEKIAAAIARGDRLYDLTADQED